MRVWVDMTASAHVLVFRPLIKILRTRGDEVEVTAREYAQTLQLLELHGIEAEVIGRHGGRSRLGKARQLWSRLHALRRWARGRDFDVALALPGRQKVRGLAKKVLLRRAAAPLLPRKIVYGRKRGFSIPAAAWLRGELEPFARDVLSRETLERQGFFRPDAVGRVLDDHVSGRDDRSRQLWGLLAFTLWHQSHVERTPQPLPGRELEGLVR